MRTVCSCKLHNSPFSLRTRRLSVKYFYVRYPLIALSVQSNCGLSEVNQNKVSDNISILLLLVLVMISVTALVLL